MTREEIIVRTESRIYELEAQKEIHDLRIEHKMDDDLPSRMVASSDFWRRYLKGLISVNEALILKLGN